MKNIVYECSMDETLIQVLMLWSDNARRDTGLNGVYRMNNMAVSYHVPGCIYYMPSVPFLRTRNTGEVQSLIYPYRPYAGVYRLLPGHRHILANMLFAWYYEGGTLFRRVGISSKQSPLKTLDIVPHPKRQELIYTKLISCSSPWKNRR